MRVLVTGSGGQLGTELCGLLPDRGYDAIALPRADLEISDDRAVWQTIKTHSPNLVINAAAHSGVDDCETELEKAYAANALGPRNLAVACEAHGADLLHVSTNYVFDGAQKRAYEPFDQPNPINAYGRTKLAGEEYVKHLTNRWHIVRTAGLYGDSPNFVRTMLRLSRERDSLSVKDDEYVSPTSARDLAGGILRLIEEESYGLYHLTNSGSCSWYEFAREILRLAGRETELLPVPSSEFPLPAPRPANGVLSSLGSPALRHWREALAEYLEREGGV